MDKIKKIIGIDISKDVIDVNDSEDRHYQYTNNRKGFSRMKHLEGKGMIWVMEATGYYHLPLARYLLSRGEQVSVVNPLSVKRYIQMRLSRIKTDKSDARMIRQYGEQNELRAWKGRSRKWEESLQVMSLLEQYSKQMTAMKNKLHGESAGGNVSTEVLKSLKRSMNQLRKEQNILEKHLLQLVREEERELLTNLESIPGLGRKTAIMLIVMTEGFRRFESASALRSYCGLTPIIRESGSSVRGRSRISKMGNQKLRNLLFLCSFTACQYNKACNDLYRRITDKGKSKKLALIAVSNKLVKQAFAIAKSGIPYDADYRSALPQK